MEEPQKVIYKKEFDPTYILIPIIASLLIFAYFLPSLAPKYDDVPLKQQVNDAFANWSSRMDILNSSKANRDFLESNLSELKMNLSNLSSEFHFLFEIKLAESINRLSILEQKANATDIKLNDLTQNASDFKLNLSTCFSLQGNLSANITSLRGDINTLASNYSQTLNWSTYFDIRLNIINSTLNSTMNRIVLIENKLCILNSSWC